MQTKTTMRYHSHISRMATINTSTKNKCWRGCGRKQPLVHCWWKCRLVQPLWKAVQSYLKKLKMDLPFDPAIPLLRIHPKKPKALIQKNVSIPVLLQLFIMTKLWKQPKCASVGEWIKQLWDVYTMEYYLAIKQKKILPFVTVWMDLENIMLSEISQSKKDKHHMISLTCGRRT